MDNYTVPISEVDEKIDAMIHSGNPKIEIIGRNLCAKKTLESRHTALNLILRVIYN